MILRKAPTLINKYQVLNVRGFLSGRQSQSHYINSFVIIGLEVLGKATMNWSSEKLCKSNCDSSTSITFFSRIQEPKFLFQVSDQNLTKKQKTKKTFCISFVYVLKKPQ